MGSICYSCFGETVNEYGICTACGYDDAGHHLNYPLALPAGSILFGRYIIGKVLGQGGYGITYLARDYQTGQKVAIKEFFPDTMATRTGTTTVTPLSGMRGEHFHYGRDSFLEEAKTMAEFNGNPHIAGVQMYFEENNTAYFVMEYLDGCSFGDYIASHGRRLSWEDTARIMLPVLDALSQIHAKGIIHRDIAPDNIFITTDGTVKLLDFGAARHSLGNVSQSLDAIVKYGFAPKEQYSRRGRQGPYTDVYAASATIYFALTGVKPDDAIDRSTEDTMPPPSILGVKISEAMDNALMKGLAVEAKDRYQSAAELKQALMAVSAGTKTEKKDNIQKDSVQEETSDGKTFISDIHSRPNSKGRNYDPNRYAADSMKDDVQMDDTQKKAVQKDPVKSTSGSREEKSTFSLPAKLLPILGIVLLIIAAVLMPRGPKTFAMAPIPYEEDIGSSATFWGQDTYKRKEVKTVSFRSSLEGMPADAWDVSAKKNGTVMAWMKDGNLTVAANGKIVPTAGLFRYMTNLTSIDFGSSIDSSSVTDMSYMFNGCHSLTSLDLSGFDTSNVTNISFMFNNCSSLTSLDLSGFDTSKVTTMLLMFYNCKSLTDVNLSSFDTSRVTDFEGMFDACVSLARLDLSNFDTSSAIDLSRMFKGCESLAGVDLSGFDTSSVTDMHSMFDGCEGLTDLDLSSFDTSNVTDMSSMFSCCMSLASLDISSFTTSADTNLFFIFAISPRLTDLKCSDPRLLAEWNR